VQWVRLPRITKGIGTAVGFDSRAASVSSHLTMVGRVAAAWVQVTIHPCNDYRPVERSPDNGAFMVMLRRTQKLIRALPTSAAPPSAQSDTALGDWYVNRLTVDRRPLLLLVSARGLLPALIPARDVSDLPDRLPDVVAARLRRLGVGPLAAAAEAAAMVPVIVAPTVDRSVVGIMVDFAKALPYYLESGAWNESTLPLVEARLAKTPCHAGRRFEQVVFPERDAPRLLMARWGAG
jgi:hypothetical protein